MKSYTDQVHAVVQAFDDAVFLAKVLDGRSKIKDRPGYDLAKHAVAAAKKQHWLIAQHLGQHATQADQLWNMIPLTVAEAIMLCNMAGDELGPVPDPDPVEGGQEACG